MKKIITIVLIVVAVGAAFYFDRTKTQAPKVPQDWKTASSAGITFSYPEKLSTTYMHAVDWPPKVAVSSTPFSCTEAGTETARAGKTEKVTVAGHTYCVTSLVEGAAGSMYTQ